MPFQKKKTWFGIAGVFVLILAGAFVWRWKSSQTTWVAARKGPVLEAVYSLGTVTSRRMFRLKLAITTGIRELFVKEGQSVSAGAPLVRFEEGITHKAPFRGTVTKLAFEEGETISPGAEILTVEDMTDRYLKLSIDQQAALRVQSGQLAKVAFESLRGQKFEGRIASVYPREGEFIATVEIRDLPPAVLPGMTADVVIEVGQKDEALLIPVAAVQNGRVTVERGGRREKILVTLGVVDGQWAQVLTGDIKENDRLLLERK